MSKLNMWVLVSNEIITEYQSYLSDPENYDGNLTDAVIEALSVNHDGMTVTQMFNSVTKNGKTYSMFSIYPDADRVTPEAVAAMQTALGDNFEILGVWTMTGMQFGTSIDEEDALVGTPTYPIPADAYLCMPDVVTYDEDGNEVSRIPATSNADLRDINFLAGHETPRQF